MQPHDFRELMTHFPSGVAVVTATDGNGEHFGLTLTALCSLSATPPLVLVCIDRDSNTLPAIRETGAFTVNLLASEAQAIAKHFASKAEQKFSALPIRAGASGGPILHEQSCAYLECTVRTRVAVADHEIIVGEPCGGSVLPDRCPLVYGRRRYAPWQSEEVPVEGLAA